MKLILLTMRDSKVGIYLNPMSALTIPSGVRDIQEMVNSPEKHLPWQKHPDDFDLYQSGTFDGETGRVQEQEPKFILNLGSLKAQ